jgi:hypothetical protein
LLQKIVEHSQGKDKFLRASLKQIYEAQDLEDELSLERETNMVLLAHIQELNDQLDTKRQEKFGEYACQFSELYSCLSSF